jgi:hypothetical protein
MAVSERIAITLAGKIDHSATTPLPARVHDQIEQMLASGRHDLDTAAPNSA